MVFFKSNASLTRASKKAHVSRKSVRNSKLPNQDFITEYFPQGQEYKSHVLYFSKQGTKKPGYQYMPKTKKGTKHKSNSNKRYSGNCIPGDLSVSMQISVVEYIPPRTERFTYQSISEPSSPAACQISSISIARCLKLIGTFAGNAC